MAGAKQDTEGANKGRRLISPERLFWGSTSDIGELTSIVAFRSLL
jgi:hypothetical protein